MKKIYLPFMAFIAIGSLNAQNLTKTASESLEFTQYGAKSVNSVSLPSLRSINAVLNETFEATTIPSSWGASNWVSSTTSTTNETKAVGHTGHFAFFDAYNLTDGTQGSLITPILQPTAGNNTLSYSVNLYKMSTNTGFQGLGAQMFVEFSTDNGTTWTTSITNILASLSGYNTTTTGWIAQSVSLAAYDGMNVMVRFRAVSDYGWANIGIDNVTGPDIFVFPNDISAAPGTMVQIDGFDYFQVIPNSQLVSAAFGVVVNNNGSADQTNVTLHANTNSGAYTSATGLNNPTSTFVAGTYDTLWTTITPSETTPTMFETGLTLTQTQTDAAPANNVADSVTFYSSDYSFYRTVNIGAILSSYSFGTSAPATTGMEFGATYFMPNSGRVDSITTLIYSNAGTGNVIGKLYTIDPTTGVFDSVASTLPYTPPQGVNTNFDLKSLALTTPFVVPAGTILAATVQLNVTTPADSIYVGSDNNFMGDASVAGVAYVKPSTAFVWTSITGQVPIVGIELQENLVGIAENNVSALISIYPNPSTGVFTIDLGTTAKASVEVYNVVGSKVIAKEFTSQASTLDMTGFDAGIYFIKVSTNNGQVTKKVTITK